MKRFEQIIFLCFAVGSFYLASCKGTNDAKKDGANSNVANGESFTISFEEVSEGGSIIASVNNEKITNNTKLPKGTKIEFLATAKIGFEVGEWSGATKDATNDKKASLTLDKDATVSVQFNNIVPKDFVLISCPEDGIIGKAIDYDVPGDDENEKTWNKGVFVQGRKVKLSPYAIAKYELTYKIWKEVYDWAIKNDYKFANAGIEGAEGFEGDPATDGKNLPVTKISWRDAIVWCNAYTNMKNGDTLQCVYLKSQTEAIPLKDATKASECDAVYFDRSKRGFRLPTEAEWEASARWQGDVATNAEKYGSIYLTRLDSASGATLPVPDKQIALPKGKTYAELNTETMRFAVYNRWYNGSEDEEVEPVVDAPQDVGLKASNYLGFFDMSGNVYEFCFDVFDGSATIDDAEYKVGDFIVDPEGYKHSTAQIPGRVRRGGSFANSAKYSILGARNEQAPHLTSNRIGVRLATSL